jgi:hypothetical protein
MKVSKLPPLNRRKHHDFVKVWATLFAGGGFINLSGVIKEHSLLEALDRLKVWKSTVIFTLHRITRGALLGSIKVKIVNGVRVTVVCGSPQGNPRLQ